MLDTYNRVADHYTHGSLEATIAEGLEELKTMTDLTDVDLLGSVDEFHIGGRPATQAMAEKLELDAAHRILDVGCGLGGTARFLTTLAGCNVSGVDLTPEYIEVGNNLNQQLGLGDQIDLHVANALTMPFEDASFDRATMLHVGMNIADKTALFAEIARTTKPGALCGIYDVMRTDNEALVYPVAWAADESTSFVASVDQYRVEMEANGFEVLSVTNKREVAISFFEAIKARLAAGGPPPLGLHIVMGKAARTKVGSMASNVIKGSIAPVEIIARRV
jgi:ubiquinone/menaquinone biosynthesis C-methylase UbiE